MKHRFYYSEKQNELGGYNFVINEKGRKVKYTQWCSNPDGFCRWDDSKLVYTCEEKPQIEYGALPDNEKNIFLAGYYVKNIKWRNE